MQNEQQQTNLLKSEQPQHLQSQPGTIPPPKSTMQDQSNTHSILISQIHSVRIKKQLQFLNKYNYTVQQNQDGTIIIKVRDLWQQQPIKTPPSSSSSSSQLEDQNLSISVIGTELTISLPKQYPFKEPLFSHSRCGVLTISELIDEWSPKYKILEMIQLIKKRVYQRTALNTLLENNLLYQAVRALESIWVWVLIAIMVRILVGFGGYSGKADWPSLGDFQAHRNWMSITVNKPIYKWYTETDENPWWRIDYPPVAAYLSLLLGSIYKHIQPQSMLLQHGYESPSLLSFMRTTVLLTDCLLLLPSLYLLILQLSPIKNRNQSLLICLILCIYLKPDQILIDHGHFQYNCLILGLILYSFYFMITERRLLACFLYTVAINSKLMAVYYSLAFFAGLVGISWRKYGRNRREKAVGEWILYAGVVLITTIIIWIPWLGSMQTFKSVLTAILPVHRGLYQLKVPNFWCISDTLLKCQTWLSKPTLTLICGLSCFLMSIPSMLAMILKPSQKVLVLGFSCVGMTFFMFSYHVHEKSILLPLCLVPFVSQYLGGRIVVYLVLGGCVGMYHLLVQDGQMLQYFVLLFVYVVVAIAYYSAEKHFISIYRPNHSYLHSQNSLNLQQIQQKPQQTSPISQTLSTVASIYIWGGLLILHLCHALIAPPVKLPYLWNLLFAFYSFLINTSFLFLCNWTLWKEIRDIFSQFKKQ